MERVLNKKSAARVMAAPAPLKKKKKLVNTIIKPKIIATAATTAILDSKKRKQDDTADIPEHDLDFLSLLSPSLSTKKAKTKTSVSTTTSTSTSATTITATTKTKSVSSKPRTGPEVVVFDASKMDRKGTSSSSGGTEFSFKKFMSSKISKLDEAPPPTENPLTADEKAEELENRRNDTELHSLIKASRLLEQYSAEQLDGVDRRRHQRDQLISLGIQKKEKIKVPLQIGFGMMAKQRERDIKELEEAKNNGTYHKSIKHTFAAAGGKKKEKSRSDRGLKTSMGRFKNGVLTLTGKEIKSVQREGVRKKKSPGKKSGGGGGGGGGKKKKGKGRH
ncbi:hypothetical protein BG011_010212 [Mortierella polycephala]|uniref:Uncharacterized protein n=1 Tax=Mortierella polycephala TaxID=41804 RepID=A0A9P6PJX9_9FUNG|nr:hypothetical protein BG011_010212 [Mortierella polycephala]